MLSIAESLVFGAAAGVVLALISIGVTADSFVN